MNAPFKIRRPAIMAIGVLLFAGLLIAQPQDLLKPEEASPPPFTLAISPVRSVVKAGVDDIPIKVVITNIIDHTIGIRHTNPDMDYEVMVSKDHGTSPPETERARSIRYDRDSFWGSVAHVNLDPGITDTDVVFVGHLYDMSQPGQYTVRVRRKVPKAFGTGVVTSNAITVTVVP